MLSSVYLAAGAAYAALDFLLIRGLERLQGPGLSPGNGEVTPPKDTPLVTVLIAARDEEHTLPRVLDALLAQDYPADEMQIVVANDRSADGTAAVLRDYATRFPGRVDFVDVEFLPEGWAPKKNALLRGLERARGEWIAVTDADCEMGPRWLSALAAHFTPETGMVLGLTAYAEPSRGARGHGAAEGARALEFVSYGITSAALVGLGFPVIANANNLAYRRRAFEEAGAFDRHGRVVSGDDDFTLQEIHATGKWGVRYCADPDALMRTDAPETWRQFWEQRKRWASKCLHYRPQQAAFLLLIFAFYLSIPALLIAGLWNAELFMLGLTGFAIKSFADFIVMAAGLRRFGLSGLLRFFPLTAMMHIPLIAAAVAAGMTGGFVWKGQRLGTKV